LTTNIVKLNQLRFYFAAINEILDLQGSFGTTFNEDEERQSDTVDEYQQYPVQKTLALPEVSRYDQIELCADPTNRYRTVVLKYKMGDVVLLATTGRARIAFYGNEELHTGNEGFSGEIYANI
jgi:hypothetical protein